MKQILIFYFACFLNLNNLLNDFLSMYILLMYMCLQTQAEFLLYPILLTDSIHLQ